MISLNNWSHNLPLLLKFCSDDDVTCRNFDILAAVFTEVLDYMHDDLGLIPDEPTDSTTSDTTSDASVSDELWIGTI